MFDFLDSDWFIIALEIVFVILIIYDVRRYIQTRKREYIFNIVITVAFAIWALYPFYKSYFGWSTAQKTELISHCKNIEDLNETKLCKCIDETIFKEFTYDEYMALDKNSTEYREFLKDAKEDCSDSGWF